MKILLVFLINIVFSDNISNWLDINEHIINSKSYKISFNQKNTTNIAGTVYLDSSNCSLMFFNNQIRYDSNFKTIIINKESLEILNKSTNQIFIENLQKELRTLPSINMLDLLKDSKLKVSKDDTYSYFESDNYGTYKIYFLNNNINRLEILYNNMEIILSDINFSIIDSIEIFNYFIIENDSSTTFDLRFE